MKAQKPISSIKKTFSLAIGIVAGLYLASTLYNASAGHSQKQVPLQDKKVPEGEPEEYSLWI